MNKPFVFRVKPGWWAFYCPVMAKNNNYPTWNLAIQVALACKELHYNED